MNARKLPRVLRPNQLKRLFEVLEQPKYMIAYLLTFFCGLRRGEVCRLKKQDLDLENGILIIRDSKNPHRSKEGYGKDRAITIPKNIISILELWLEYNPNSEYVISRRDGQNIPYSHQILWKKFKTDLKRAGLDTQPRGFDKGGNRRSEFTYHSLRHAYGTYLYEHGVPIHTLQALMGHSDTRTTMIYVELSTKVKQEAVNKVFCNNAFDRLTQRNIERPQPNNNTELEMIREQNRAKELELKKIELLKEINPIKIERKE